MLIYAFALSAAILEFANVLIVQSDSIALSLSTCANDKNLFLSLHSSNAFLYDNNHLYFTQLISSTTIFHISLFADIKNIWSQSLSHSNFINVATGCGTTCSLHIFL